MGSYAVGKQAFGFCDRCGFRYPLKDLKPEVVNLAVINTLVCPECWDPDQPQNHLGHLRIQESEALRNPRPPLGLVESQQFINSQSGSPLNILDPERCEFGLGTDRPFNGTRLDAKNGSWWDLRNLDGFTYSVSGKFPPETGATGGISVSTGILSCPWVPDTTANTTDSPIAYNANQCSLEYWDWLGGGGNPKINMVKNRYVIMEMRVTSWGDNYPAIYAEEDPWAGVLYCGVTDPSIGNYPYPFGYGNSPNSIQQVLSNPGFTGDSSELNVWKTLVWDVMDNNAGEYNDRSGSSWVQSAVFGFNVTCFRFDLFIYGDSVGNQAKVAFDVRSIKFTDTLD